MKKLIAKKFEKNDETMTLILEEVIDEQLALELKDGERMLVDSDQLAFIYILEDSTQFYYVTIPQELWKDLADIHRQEQRVDVKLTDQVTVELKALHHELSFLLENIAGNGNYGEELEKVVTSEFML
ncbi:hypothetical protein BALCAV_0210945 [Alkalihalobacillus alcalophilus ATCC 27647 = CGMCC 1.3604]|nr:hypothetical protein [Alkalihalobacillus alcalophilus]KGA97318.1 hypothetical protein BALCAV_0210945 [Alkalihalobacillus alcalophilus ATCC 27647 = CGMCC 1.3604]MED1562503.1 hypothetical protein [Alkalihalobacillus alcalophilus]